VRQPFSLAVTPDAAGRRLSYSLTWLLANIVK
jgi:hypothetical protein